MKRQGGVGVVVVRWTFQSMKPEWVLSVLYGLLNTAGLQAEFTEQLLH